jgi:hypothetical protein
MITGVTLEVQQTFQSGFPSKIPSQAISDPPNDLFGRRGGFDPDDTLLRAES